MYPCLLDSNYTFFCCFYRKLLFNIGLDLKYDKRIFRKYRATELMIHSAISFQNRKIYIFCYIVREYSNDFVKLYALWPYNALSFKTKIVWRIAICVIIKWIFTAVMSSSVWWRFLQLSNWTNCKFTEKWCFELTLRIINKHLGPFYKTLKYNTSFT